MIKSIKNDLSKFIWPDDILSKMSGIISNADAVANLAYKNIFDTSDKIFNTSPKKTGQLCSVLINMEQVPNYDSRVLLGDSLDPLGLPVLKFDWQLSEAEMKTLSVAVNGFSAMLARNQAGRFKVNSDVADGSPEFSISCHHSGTTRMSNVPEKGVVDENCKVHGIENLYIAGSSVFPSAGWANPTLTIVAMAIRLSQYVKLSLVRG